mgnify:CR=1 FL=1
MGKKKVALIGYGYWGQKIYRYLKESEDFDIQYVFFRSLKNLSGDNIKKKYGSEFVSTIDSILEDENVPNVIITTPIETHYALTKQALLNSKNVLVEKPLATNPEHSMDLLRLARNQKLKLETEYTFTYSEALSRAQALVKEGAIGRVESINLTKKQLGRFLQYDVYALLGAHCLSILDMFLPVSGCSFFPRPLMSNKGVTTAAIISFESRDKKCQGYINLSLHCPVRETKVEIYGERGTLIYDPSAANTLSLVCYSRSQLRGTNKVDISTEKMYRSSEDHNLRRALKHFSDVIENGASDNSKRAADITEVISAF